MRALKTSHASDRTFLRVACAVIVLWRAAWWPAGAEPMKTPPPDALETQSGLKAAPGRELVLAHCLPCHSTAIIAANHLTRERWAELITKMQERNGMRPVSQDARQRILDYLESAQRPADAGLNAAKETPWATPLYRPNPIW